MENILLIVVIIFFLIIGYLKIGKIDQTIENISQQKKTLVIYDQTYISVRNYQNEDILFIEKSDISHFSQEFSIIIICTIDDYYNLMMNYHIQKSMHSCDVYATCYENSYLQLYHQKNIHILQTQDDIKGLLERLYDESMETTY